MNHRSMEAKTSKESNSSRRFRVLMFPWLAHGHMSPFLQLSKRLAKNYNFQIYFCSTENNLNFIKENKNMDHDYFSNHSMELVQLDLPDLPGHDQQNIPSGNHMNTKDLHLHLKTDLKCAFYWGRNNFRNILDTVKPDLLIYDVFQPWAAEMAALIHIPSVLFLPIGAVSMSRFYHRVNCSVSGTNHEPYPFPAIFMRDYERKVMELVCREIEDTEPEEVQFSSKCFEQSTDIVLVKSWRGMEGKYVDHLSVSCGKKVIPVGPLNEKEDETNNIEEENDSHIIKFLNGKDEKSVVYVAFGSQYFLSKEEREEMAHGLELSNANFIWVVSFPVGTNITLEEALSEGFLQRVKERGIVVDKWVPQAKILGHPSTGAFVSHCGWGSIMESMYSGVPLLALPMLYEQFIHARLAVELGAGIEILRDEDGRIKKEEVAKVIKEVVVEKNGLGRVVEETIGELSKKMRAEGEKELHEAVEKLRDLCSKNQLQSKETLI